MVLTPFSDTAISLKSSRPPVPSVWNNQPILLQGHLGGGQKLFGLEQKMVKHRECSPKKWAGICGCQSQKMHNRFGDGSKPYPPSVHIKIAGLKYGCSSPKNGMYRYWSIAIEIHPHTPNMKNQSWLCGKKFWHHTPCHALAPQELPRIRIMMSTIFQKASSCAFFEGRVGKMQFILAFAWLPSGKLSHNIT